jgi:leucyl-tRNA---protein transferase
LSLTNPRRFYTTEPGECPYLEGKVEQRVVTTLGRSDATESLNVFSELGFRRSQTYLYRPACPRCNACVPVRIVVQDFVPSRRFRKVLVRNEDLGVSIEPAIATDEQYELFRRYQQARHSEGSMAQMDRFDFTSMVEDAAPVTLMAEFRYRDGSLAGVSLTDQLSSGLSGVYKFFDPAAARRSLGTFIVLWHIARARELGLPYVYLGYWIAGSKTMDYKADFQPLERLQGGQWRPFASPAKSAEDPSRQPGGEARKSQHYA